MLLESVSPLRGHAGDLPHDVVDGLIGLAAGGGRFAEEARRLLHDLCAADDPPPALLAALLDPALADPDGRAKRLQERPGGSALMRLAVAARETRHGNLSVVVSQRAYDGAGKWGWAGEWRPDLPIWTLPSGDELMFVRDIGPLLRESAGDGERGEFHRLRARAVTARFWRVARRLAERFDVAVESYPEAVADGQHAALRIVDPVSEQKLRIAASLAGFEKNFGHPPDVFWRLTAPFRRNAWLGKDTAARNLNRIGGRIRLVPSRIAEGNRILEAAAGFGLYAAPADPDPQPAPTRKKPAPERRVPEAVPPRPGHGGLSYEGLRAVALDETIARELGVADTVDLIEKLNRLWAARGEPPLTHGDYPTGAARLARVVKMYREETRSGG